MIRTRQARLTLAAMVVVLLLGCGAVALVLRARTAPTDDAAGPVIDQARRLAVATAAYDDSGLVQAEAMRVAALAGLDPADLPGFLQSDVEGYQRLRTRSRADLVTDLMVQDDAGRQAHDQLLATPGYRDSAAVAATLGPLAPERVQAFRDHGATAADLAPYDSAITELDSLHQARDPAQAQLLQSVAALEKAPAPGDVPPNWGLLAAIAIAVLALEVALGSRLVGLVGAAEADVSSEADRRREQVVSMFLVARRLTSGRPGPAIAATVAEETSWTLDADFASVLLVDGVTLVPVASYGDVRVERIASSSGLLGRCADTIQTQQETVPADPAVPDEAGPLTLLAAPVLIHQRVGGVLLAGRRGSVPFAADDETALTLLAHVTGGALEHAPSASATRPRLGVAVGAPRGAERSAGTVAPEGPAARDDDPARETEAGRDAGVAATSDGREPIELGAAEDPVAAVPAPAASDDPGPEEERLEAEVAVADGAPAPASRATTDPGPADAAASPPAPPSPPDAPAPADPTAGWPRALPASGNVVRVLLPDLEARRDGSVRKLAGASARLLAVLVAQRQPVTVDKLADLLWPDIDLSAGRNRLNVTVHRLRKSLGLDADELLVRSADGIALVPGTRWVIDAWLFWDLSGADRDAEDHARAYDLHRAAFCARQFAYEDALGLERDRILARWGDLTLGLLDDGAVDATVAADRALAFGVLDDDVLRRIADALEAAGHTAQAATLISAIDQGRLS